MIQTMKFWATILFAVSVVNVIDCLELNCHFLDFQYSFFDEYYTCQSYNFGTTLHNRTVTSVNGVHLIKGGNVEVQQLYIRGQTCEVIPKGITNFFPDLKSLSMPHAKIQYLFKDDLIEYKNLRALDFAYSKFKKVDAKYFIHTPHLEVISFRRCRELETFGQKTFDSLLKLKTLQLNEVKCIDSQVVDNRMDVVRLLMKVKVQCSDPNEPPEQTTETLFQPLNLNLITDCRLRIASLERENLNFLNIIKDLSEKKNCH
ncbi:CLUMA_CG018805, isoform A [Clunio marinus]|uniref:CLUMA_CG018805, isoform A n=1 Tax=Clunio marinus TaxID=568069 RepID=A0A1J1J4I0_9DIPT|nr:CLUMA_CG018805, isoform A [Clunio marinus]